MTYQYQVADLTFELKLAKEDSLNQHLSNYEPFHTDQHKEVIFRLTVCPDQAEMIDLSHYNETISFEEETQHFSIYKSAETNDTIIVMTLSHAKSCTAYLQIQEDYSNGILSVRGSSAFRYYSLNNSLMMMFAFASAPHNMLLQHSSVIVHKGKGYLFLGKSGTGKSTHSSLWLKHIEGSMLLNDDNPVIGINKDGVPTVYGSPWSGKTPCYKNDSATIGGFVRLWQAPKNEIQKMNVIQAYAALLPTVSGMKWERKMADAMNKTLNALVTKVPVFNLNCLPDEEAAWTSFHALTRE